MKKVFWKSGQRVIKQILDWLQDAGDNSILERKADLTDYGIVKNLLNEFDIIVGSLNTPATPKITVRTGVAYDTNGQRINIDNESISYNGANATHTTDDGSGSFVSTPRSTGSFNVSLTTNINNYIWIEYLQATEDAVFTLHKLLNTKIFYKQTDGYKITVTSVNTPPSVVALKLGNVDLTAGGVVSTTTISKANRVLGGISHYRVKIHTTLADKSDRTLVYTPNQEIYADDHVRAVGTGVVGFNNPHGLSPTDIGLSPASTIQEHQEFFHSNGLIVPNEVSTTSALFPIVTLLDPGLDYITFKALTGTERVHVGGDVIVSSDISSDVDVLFTALDPSGLWYIYVDRTTKTIQKTQTNLIATPDISKFLLVTITWLYPGDMGAGDGDLSGLIDRRKFGTIATRDIQANAVTSSEIDPSVAGNGLSGGNGTPLAVNTSFGLEIVADNVRVAATIAGNGLAYSSGVIDVNVDNSTIEINTDTLRVKASGITSAQLATSVAGNGLSGGGGSPLAVNVDNSTIEINADTLRVKASGITGNELNISVAGNGLAGGGGSPLSVNVSSGLEISADALRISSSAAGNGLSGGSGSPLAVNVDGTYITITGDTVSATDLIKPMHYVADTGTAFQWTDFSTSTFTTVYSFSGKGALKGATWLLTSNPNSGGASFNFKLTIDGHTYTFNDLRTGVNAGQGWGTVNNYAYVANSINSASAIGIVSGVDSHSQFYFGFTTGFTLQVQPLSASDGRWGYTPYVSYERV
jgi:hypothetical protein